MRILKKTILVMLTMLAGLSVVSGNASAQELRFATTIPSQIPLATEVFDPWAKRVSEASGGTVSIKVFHGETLANFRTIFDVVRSGAADIGWISTSSVPGQFNRVAVADLPFEFSSSETASIALWKMLENGVFKTEFDDVVVLALHTFPPLGIHSTKSISNLEDIKGKKIIALSESTANVVQGLGGVPISVSFPELYTSLSRGLADAAMLSWSAIVPFKLHEPAKFHVEVPLGGGAAFVAINKDRWEKLPQSAKSAFLQESGLEWSRQIGVSFDRTVEWNRSTVAKDPEQVIVNLDETQLAAWRDTLAPLAEKWAKSLPDGQDILTRFREQLNLASGN